ncbi:MAG: hypothetical protein ACWGMZ_12715, partial [Thermoguttaceae bacterium]
MIVRHSLILLSLANLLALNPAFAAEELSPPEEARIKAYEKMLPNKAQGIGPTIDQREPWENLAKHPDAERIIGRADRALLKPMPELTDEVYLDFYKTGDRDLGQGVIFGRQQRLNDMVLAECFENRGRFLKAIEEAIRSICRQKTWFLPASDLDQRNFKGEEINIDLNCAHVAATLSLASYWLGDKLSPEVRKLIAQELERRIFTPITNALTTGKPYIFWFLNRTNWNAVCLANTTAAALTSIDSLRRRAFFAAAAEKYIENYLKGVTPDGYCSEGIGYWNYGFGHFAMLAEILRQQTHGKVDLLVQPRIRPLALYGRRMEMLPGIYPTFADCSVKTRPDVKLMSFLSRRLNLGWKDYENLLSKPSGTDHLRFLEVPLFLLPYYVPDPEQAHGDDALRDWFSDGQVLICRPRPDAIHALCAAIKGGHNSEAHNHNDVGSFVVALGRSSVLVDPGKEIYKART